MRSIVLGSECVSFDGYMNTDVVIVNGLVEDTTIAVFVDSRLSQGVSAFAVVAYVRDDSVLSLTVALIDTEFMFQLKARGSRSASVQNKIT